MNKYSDKILMALAERDKLEIAHISAITATDEAQEKGLDTLEALEEAQARACNLVAAFDEEILAETPPTTREGAIELLRRLGETELFSGYEARARAAIRACLPLVAASPGLVEAVDLYAAAEPLKHKARLLAIALDGTCGAYEISDAFMVASLELADGLDALLDRIGAVVRGGRAA